MKTKSRPEVLGCRGIKEGCLGMGRRQNFVLLALGIHNRGVTWTDLCFRMFIPTEYNRTDWSQGD